MMYCSLLLNSLCGRASIIALRCGREGRGLCAFGQRVLMELLILIQIRGVLEHGFAKLMREAQCQ